MKRKRQDMKSTSEDVDGDSTTISTSTTATTNTTSTIAAAEGFVSRQRKRVKPYRVTPTNKPVLLSPETPIKNLIKEVRTHILLILSLVESNFEFINNLTLL